MGGGPGRLRQGCQEGANAPGAGLAFDKGEVISGEFPEVAGLGGDAAELAPSARFPHSVREGGMEEGGERCSSAGGREDVGNVNA
jgi:hypothetical protein